MEDLKTVRAALEKKLAVLIAREKSIGGDMRQPSERDSEERAVELENAEVLQKLDHQIAEEIQLLRKAIGRMDSGSYGTCTTCGKNISKERLKALPHTPTCANCA
jgi:RNA polymerase-binding transcription factor DksA